MVMYIFRVAKEHQNDMNTWTNSQEPQYIAVFVKWFADYFEIYSLK